MQFGIMSTALAAEGLEQALGQAAEAGADGLEVVYQTDRQAAELSIGGYPARLRQAAEDAGVKVPSICLGVLCRRPSLIGTPEQIAGGRQKVLAAIQAAAEGGVETVLVPFFAHNAIEMDEELSRAAEALAALAEPAEQAGVTLGVESTLNFGQQQFLLDSVGHSHAVRMYVDTANALARKLDFATGLRDLGSAGVAQIHFKDVRLVEGQPPDYAVALGEGNVDFQAAARAIEAIGYDGWIVMETPPGHHPPASARANLDFARKLLGQAA
jgi:sugar phosphate isomerase/epimerase